MTYPELVIFDCDGVLIDSEFVFYEAYATALQDHGCMISASELADRFSGFSGEAIVAELSEEITVPLTNTFYADVGSKILERYKAGILAMPGAAQVLQLMKTKRCVASSASPTKLALGLIQADLFDFVYPHIFSSNLVSNPKPSPEIFQFSAEKFGVQAAGCLVVEDSVAGITAAKSAGMTAWGFVGGAHCNASLSDKLRLAGADRIFNRLSDILELTERQ